MKRYLRGCIFLILALTVLPLAACKGEKTEEPRLRIMAGKQEIKGIYYGNQYNETREEIEKRLKRYMEDKSLEELPYVALNEKITIETVNFKTEELAVFDYILTENGVIRYNENVVQTSVVPVDQGKAVITLSPNFAVGLSSNSKDYKPGKTIRCFVLRADIEGSSFAFAFILRTDANVFLN